eukprot:7439283-Pyramimonas_sp.AAC.1
MGGTALAPVPAAVPPASAAGPAAWPAASPLALPAAAARGMAAPCAPTPFAARLFFLDIRARCC